MKIEFLGKDILLSFRSSFFALILQSTASLTHVREVEAQNVKRNRNFRNEILRKWVTVRLTERNMS